MENKKKYLTEENYEKGKKVILKIAIAVLVIGLLIGIGLIVAGVSSFNSKEEVNDNTVPYEESGKSLEEINLEIENVENQINEINQNINSLKAEKNKEFMANGFSDKYYEISSEIDSENSKISSLNFDKTSLLAEKQLLNSGISSNTDITNGQNNLDNVASKGIGGILIVLGLGVLLFTFAISGSLFLFYKKREILAFTAQQSIPVVKEGIDEMAPTIGNVAKEISKGISSGIKDKEEK